MRRLLGHSLLALTLTACAARSPLPTHEGSSAPPETAPQAGTTAGTSGPAGRIYRPGTGTVDSASVLSLSSSGPAAAGGTARPATSPTMAYRVQMSDGSEQSIVQAGERFAVGDRVTVTADGRLTRP